MSDDEILQNRYWTFVENNLEALRRHAYNACRRCSSPSPTHDGEEVLQDAIISASSALQLGEDENHCLSWLKSRINDRAVDALRKRIVRSEAVEKVASGYREREVSSPAEFEDRDITFSTVHQALDCIKNPKERLFLELYYFHNADTRPTLEEVALKMGYSTTGINNLALRARASFKKLFRSPQL